MRGLSRAILVAAVAVLLGGCTLTPEERERYTAAAERVRDTGARVEEVGAAVEEVAPQVGLPVRLVGWTLKGAGALFVALLTVKGVKKGVTIARRPAHERARGAAHG